MDTKVGIKYELENIGNAPSNSFQSSTTVRKELNNFQRDLNGKFIDDIGRSLNINEKDTINEPFFPREEGLSLGSWYIHTETNCEYNSTSYCTRDIGESNFGNNIIYKNITIRDSIGLPNLHGAITTLSPASADLGDSSLISFFIVNDTNATTFNPTYFEISFYTSPDPNFDGGKDENNEKWLTNVIVSDSLYPSDTIWLSKKVLIEGKSLQVGTSYIVGRIDPNMNNSEFTHDDNSLIGFPFYLNTDECWFIFDDEVIQSPPKPGFPDTLDFGGYHRFAKIHTENDCSWHVSKECYKTVPLYENDSIVGDTLLPCSINWSGFSNSNVGEKLGHFAILSNPDPYWRELKFKFGQQNFGGKYDSLHIWQRPRPHPDYVAEFVGLTSLYGTPISTDSIPRLDSIKATYLIKNLGDNPIENDNITLKLQRANDNPFTSSTWIDLVSPTPIPKLDSGMIDTINLFFVLDEVDTSYVGQLKFIIDAYQKQPELREDNNEIFVNIKSYNDGKSRGNITLNQIDSLDRYDVILKTYGQTTDFIKTKNNNSTSGVPYHYLSYKLINKDTTVIPDVKIDFRITSDSIFSANTSRHVASEVIQNINSFDSLVSTMQFKPSLLYSQGWGWQHGYMVINSDRRFLEDNYNDNIHYVRFKSAALPIDSSNLVGLGIFQASGSFINGLISGIDFAGTRHIDIPAYLHTDTLQFGPWNYAVILKTQNHPNYQFIDTITPWRRYYPYDQVLIPITKLPQKNSSYPHFTINQAISGSNTIFLPKIQVYTNGATPVYEYLINLVKPDADYELNQLTRALSNTFYNNNSTKFNLNSIASINIIYRNKALFSDPNAHISLDTLGLKLVMSNDNSISSDDWLMLDTVIATPNSSTIFDTINYQLPIDSIPLDFEITSNQGRVYLLAKIDSKDWVWENNENDNERTSYINIFAPNYQFSNVYMNNAPFPVTLLSYNTNIQFSYHLKNDYPFIPNIQIPVSTNISYVKQNIINNQLEDDEVFPIITFDTIPENISTTYKSHNLVPNGLTNGAWKLRVHVDYDNKVRERIESDNIEDRLIFVNRDSTGMPNALIDTLIIASNNIAIGDTLQLILKYQNTEDTVITGMKGIAVFGDDYENVLNQDSTLGTWILSSFGSLSGQIIDTLNYVVKHGSLGSHFVSVIFDPQFEVAELEKFDNIQSTTFNIIDTSCHYYINNQFAINYANAFTCNPNEVGVTLHTYPNINGCDSLVEITTVLLPIDTTHLSEIVCNPADTGLFVNILSNQYGCDSTIIINKYHLPLTIQSSIDSVECKGDNTGNITIHTIGGTAPYAYLWNDSSTIASRTNLYADNYTLTVTDVIGCTISTTIPITEPEYDLTTNLNILSDYNGLPISCIDSDDGILGISPFGGTAPYQQQWSTGESTLTIDSLTQGDYSVTLTDNNGCTVSDSINLVGSPIVFNSAIVDVSCHGATQGEINLNIQGGASPYSVNWSHGAIGDSLTNLVATTYSATITDNNNCSINDTFSIAQPSAITVNSNIQSVSCYGYSDGSIDLTISGGVGNYTTTWSNGTVNEDIFNVGVGIYDMIVLDSNGCSYLDTFIIDAQSQIALNFQVQQTTCGFDNGQIISNINGGISPYNLSWNNGINSDTLYDLSPDVYSLSIIDSIGCTFTDSVIINPSSSPSILLDSLNNTSCYGYSDGSINISIQQGTAPYNYIWNDSTNTQDRQSLTAGLYILTVTDTLGCFALDSIMIDEPPLLSVDTTIQHACNNNDGSIFLSTSGGTAPYQYDWNINGLSGDSISNLDPNTYIVTITDFNNCIDTQTIQIDGSPLADFDTDRIGDTVVFYSQSQYANTHFWNFGNGTTSVSEIDSIAYDSSGIYNVSLTVSNHCGSHTKSDTVKFILTNLQEYFKDNTSFTLYPNPTSGKLNLRMANISHGSWSISILDSKGSSLKEQIVEVNSDEVLQTFYLNELINGVYFMKFIYEGQVVPVKLAFIILK